VPGSLGQQITIWAGLSFSTTAFTDLSPFAAGTARIRIQPKLQQAQEEGCPEETETPQYLQATRSQECRSVRFMRRHAVLNPN